MDNSLPKLNTYRSIIINPDDLKSIMKAAKEKGLEVRSLTPKYYRGKIMKFIVSFKSIK